MLDVFSKFSSEYRTFNLSKINIEDEGMEDLEKFNQIYNIDNSKCSLFDEINQVNNFNISYNESKSSNFKTEFNCSSKINISFFRIDLYFKRIIQNMKKPQIKKLILELGSLSCNNYFILSKIKSTRSSWTKEKFVDLTCNIILELINKKNEDI